MRLRIPELLEEREMTPYALSVASKGRISMSTAYRLARLRGQVKCFDAGLLSALCDVLELETGALFERVPAKRASRSR